MLDRIPREVRRTGQLIELKRQEFRQLEYLISRAGRVVTRTMLQDGVWDVHFDPQTTVVGTQISRLRAKIDRGFHLPSPIPSALRSPAGAFVSPNLCRAYKDPLRERCTGLANKALRSNLRSELRRVV